MEFWKKPLCPSMFVQKSGLDLSGCVHVSDAVLKSLDMRRKASKGENSMDTIVLARPLKY